MIHCIRCWSAQGVTVRVHFREQLVVQCEPSPRTIILSPIQHYHSQDPTSSLEFGTALDDILQRTHEQRNC
ncbi:unnamed protein product, partial [Adineta ricciae]